MLLENGVTYRGSIIITHSRWTIDNLGGGMSGIKQKLQDGGFANLTVWDNPSNLPSDWPANQKQDTSGSGETEIWIEGTWNKSSGDYPSSTSDFYVKSYWIQNKSSQPQPQPNIPAVDNNQPPPAYNQPPINTNTSCVYKSQSCDNTPCCEGYTCLQDTSGYWGGGMRCFDLGTDELPPGTNSDKDNVQPITEILPQPEQKQISPWWYALGALLVGGIVTAVGVKAMSSNKSES